MKELGFEPGVVGLIAAMGGLSAFIGAVVAGPAARRLGDRRQLMAALGCSACWEPAHPPRPRSDARRSPACLVGQQLLADSALVVFEIGDVTIPSTIVPEHLLGGSPPREGDSSARLLIVDSILQQVRQQFLKIPDLLPQ